MTKTPYTLTVGTTAQVFSRKDRAVKAGEATGESFTVTNPSGNVVHAYAKPIVEASTKTCRKDASHEYRTTKSGGYCYTCDRIAFEGERARREAAKQASTDAERALAGLTPNGQAFMAQVGSRGFDHFDNGIVEGSGNWGEGMAWQFAETQGVARRAVPGIMAALAKSGMWTVEVQDGQAWWELTTLGAEVARLAAK